MSRNNPALSLSFVENDGKSIDYWNVAQTGSYASDCELGRILADETFNVMRANDCPIILVHILAAQVRKKRWCGIEIGFAQAIAEALP